MMPLWLSLLNSHYSRPLRIGGEAWAWNAIRARGFVFFRDFEILFTSPHVICTYSILSTSVRLCGTTSGGELSRVNTVSKWLAKIWASSASFIAMEPFGLLNPGIGSLFLFPCGYTWIGLSGSWLHSQWRSVHKLPGDGAVTWCKACRGFVASPVKSFFSGKGPYMAHLDTKC